MGAFLCLALCEAHMSAYSAERSGELRERGWGHGERSLLSIKKARSIVRA